MLVGDRMYTNHYGQISRLNIRCLNFPRPGTTRSHVLRNGVFTASTARRGWWGYRKQVHFFKQALSKKGVISQLTIPVCSWVESLLMTSHRGRGMVRGSQGVDPDWPATTSRSCLLLSGCTAGGRLRRKHSSIEDWLIIHLNRTKNHKCLCNLKLS